MGLRGATSRLLGLFIAAILDSEPRPIERLRLEKVDRLIDRTRRLRVVNLTTVGTLGRLQRCIRFQIQIQVLNLVQTVPTTATTTTPKLTTVNISVNVIFVNGIGTTAAAARRLVTALVRTASVRLASRRCTLRRT